ncbi:type II toxin-antitoxin system antitoxin SocA domain-containing protein [Bacillus safensis]|uniref:type II toxin-antitoxin system antitoxin SocA domain-containing protein n=1 Tax=Bacillus safensis TaxID=561879 RepID=UPI00148ED1BF|nr:DUF4065 domain-containing protein [Bacillus safensis]
MAEVRNVAKYFLSKSIENTQYAITPLKLQKLLYYAQGIHLRDNNGTPLFDGNLLRWDHGPVNRIIYDDYKTYGYFTIPQSSDNGKNDLTKSEIKAIEQAWELYGELDGKFLEELTHQEDPWLTTLPNQIISKEKIYKYFMENQQVASVW